MQAVKLNELLNLPKRNQQQATPPILQPTAVKRQARVGKVVARMMANDQKQPPTEMDVVQGMSLYADMKSRNDKSYAQRGKRRSAKSGSATR